VLYTSLGSRYPGIMVPSREQKQSGGLQAASLHTGAAFGSFSTSEICRVTNFDLYRLNH
jgi:hypothetical protein